MASADLAIDFYERVLRLPDVLDDNGDPRPFILEPPLAFIIGSLMGWLGRDGYRRFREGYIEMGKGNAKTPLLAGLGLFGLTMDRESAPEIYAAAVNRYQAQIMFRDAVRMVGACPDLSGLLTVSGIENPHNVSNPDNLGFFRPFSRDQGIKSGPRPSMALIDEVHEHPTAEVINKLKAGFKHRKQPLAVLITNSGFDRASICFQMHQHADLVLREQVQDDRLFAYVCALDEGDDPLTDRSCWVKTNPLIGVTITEEYLERQVQNGKNLPSELNTVLRLNFCVWTNQHTRAIDMAQWAACQQDISDAELAEADCYGGLDLGQSDDISSFVKIWVLSDGRVAVRARHWLPESALRRHQHRPYDEWRRSGHLEVTEGNTTDFQVVQDAIEDDAFTSSVRELAYDPHFANQMAQNLQGHGLVMVPTAQGFHLNEATTRLLELIAAGELCVARDPVLAFMASNFVVRHGKNGEIRPDKDEAAEKIDGIVALIMALDRGVIRNGSMNGSVYDRVGAEVFTV